MFERYNVTLLINDGNNNVSKYERRGGFKKIDAWASEFLTILYDKKYGKDAFIIVKTKSRTTNNAYIYFSDGHVVNDLSDELNYM